MGPSLPELLAELPDPRDPRGIRYPLVPILALCLVAALAGYTSLTAISQFGRLRKHRLAHALGFKRGTIPAASTLSDLFRDLDAEHLDRLIGRWLTASRTRLVYSARGSMPSTRERKVLLQVQATLYSPTVNSMKTICAYAMSRTRRV